MRPLASTLLLLVISALPLPAWSQPTLYRIAGRVVSQADAHPLQQATVRISTVPDGKPVQSTTSTAEGAFIFEGVPAGKYSLAGDAPGFVSTTYDQHGGFSTAIVTGSSVSSESLTLQLIPKATLSGSITDTSGEPVAGASVFLFRQSEDFGDGPLTPAGTTNTNDIGQYEFTGLAAGSYFVAVQGRPWYAVASQPSEPAGFPLGIAGTSDPLLNVAYPITYYPGVTRESEATPLVLRAGENSADLRLGSVPAVEVTFANVLPPQPGAQAGLRTFSPRMPQLQVQIFGTHQFVPAPTQITGTSAVLSGLAPGDYILRSSQSGPTTELGHVALTQSISTEFPAANSLARLHLTLRLADGAPAVGAQVSLIPARGGEALTAPADAHGELVLSALPGDYNLQIFGLRQSVPMFLRQMLSAGTPVSTNPLHIVAPEASAAPLALTATLAPGNMKVEGFARKDGKPCPGAFILLIPADELHDPHDWRTDQSDLDGSFTLSGLAPGDYLLFAIDKGWQLRWREDGVLARYTSGALLVRLADSPTHSQHLEQPVSVQPRP